MEGRISTLHGLVLSAAAKYPSSLAVLGHVSIGGGENEMKFSRKGRDGEGLQEMGGEQFIPLSYSELVERARLISDHLMSLVRQ